MSDMKINGMTDWRLMRMFEGENEGAGADDKSGDGGDGDKVGSGGDGEGGVKTALTPPEGDKAGADDKSGDGGKDAGGEGAEGKTGDKADAKSDESGAASDVEIVPPEGREHFKEDYGTYSTFVDGLLKDNPKMTAKEALLAAANWQAERVQKALDGADGEALALLEDQVKEWADAGMKDAEFGGDKYDENVATAIKGLEHVAGDEIKTILSQTGLGSHPEVIRMFLKIGTMLGDPSIVTAGGSVADKRDAAEILYPKKT